jgi:hypothetical protein
MRQEGPLSTMQYYSAIRKNEGMSFARKWIELETIMLSLTSQDPKAKYRRFAVICSS